MAVRAMKRYRYIAAYLGSTVTASIDVGNRQVACRIHGDVYTVYNAVSSSSAGSTAAAEDRPDRAGIQRYRRSAVDITVTGITIATAINHFYIATGYRDMRTVIYHAGTVISIHRRGAAAAAAIEIGNLPAGHIYMRPPIYFGDNIITAGSGCHSNSASHNYRTGECSAGNIQITPAGYRTLYFTAGVVAIDIVTRIDLVLDLAGRDFNSCRTANVIHDAVRISISCSAIDVIIYSNIANNGFYVAGYR